MRHFGRAFATLTVLSSLAWLGTAAAAGNKSVAYYSAYQAYTSAYLIDWQGASRARVVNGVGNADGTVVRNGSQRVITLQTPISQQYQDFDVFDPCINDSPTVRQDTSQVAVNSLSGNDNRGTSAVIELGTITTLNGCNAGQTQPFGSLSDPGFQTNNVSMALRPPVSDLVPGASLAGPSEEARDDSGQLTADVITFQADGQVSFAATGHVYGGAFDADQWLQLALPSGPRAYARIAVDRRSGAERWLDADWADGRPARLQVTLMVKPVAGAGFGTVAQASRKWQSGVATSDLTAFYIALFQDGTGDRISVDLGSGVESHSAISSWAFDGNSIVQKRGSGVKYTRTWVPLANGGGRTRFVLESELAVVVQDGSQFVNIKPRVNVYSDTGPAAPAARR